MKLIVQVPCYNEEHTLPQAVADIPREIPGIVRKLAGIRVPDTVSGFRAFSREAAIRLNVVSSYSYTIETVIQAGKRDIAVTSVPVRTNPETRESRLFKGMTSFISRQVSTIVRMYAMYQPLKVFFYISVILTVVGALPILRFIYYYLLGQGDGHLQSLTLGGVLVLMGFIAFLAGLVADLISFNRQLLEMTLERVRRMELEGAETDSAGEQSPQMSESQVDPGPRPPAETTDERPIP